MAGDRETAWRAASDGSGVVVRVRLTPRSSADVVDGLEDTADGVALRARVRAVPEDGKANGALESLLARWMGLGKRSVAVTGGHKSRQKTVTVAGSPDELIVRLRSLCDPVGRK